MKRRVANSRRKFPFATPRVSLLSNRQLDGGRLTLPALNTTDEPFISDEVDHFGRRTRCSKF